MPFIPSGPVSHAHVPLSNQTAKGKPAQQKTDKIFRTVFIAINWSF